MTADIVAETNPPIWFLGMPYTAGTERSLGTLTDVYKPLLEEGLLTTDVGVGLRITDQNGGPPRFVLAGCYGAGTLGVARLMMNADRVREFGALDDVSRFEVVARAYLSEWDVATTEPVTTREW
jgi:hypothetical protein